DHPAAPAGEGRLRPSRHARMTASGNPPPLPHQILAQLQLTSHLQTLKVLFYALAGFHWFATVAFLGLSGWVAHSRGLDDAWMLTTVYA
ncbi:hypothetical protein, partial [Serratia marcescens]|uniref:hypothetical protein n=1 Tax=Serratia marcescens TaxID=615 RepID=UPI0019544085